MVRASLNQGAHDRLEKQFCFLQIVLVRLDGTSCIVLPFLELGLLFVQFSNLLLGFNLFVLNCSEQVVGFFEDWGKFDVFDLFVRHILLNIIRVFFHLLDVETKLVLFLLAAKSSLCLFFLFLFLPCVLLFPEVGLKVVPERLELEGEHERVERHLELATFELALSLLQNSLLVDFRVRLLQIVAMLFSELLFCGGCIF